MFPFQNLKSYNFSRCNTESDWYQIHENIIKKLNARYNLTGSNAGESFAAFLFCFLSGFLVCKLNSSIVEKLTLMKETFLHIEKYSLMKTYDTAVHVHI